MLRSAGVAGLFAFSMRFPAKNRTMIANWGAANSAPPEPTAARCDGGTKRTELGPRPCGWAGCPALTGKN
jgi:hypothetical protein